jgi:molybdenum cofactor biosynthesis enzyme MoaA
MKLEDIGFYTLSDRRAECPDGPLMRAEMVLTNRCNFNCPYCRKTGDEMSFADAAATLAWWIEDGLQNVRFSGGEPTLVPFLPVLVAMCKRGGVKNIALSTNGSASPAYYRQLIDDGVNDFSISLDACCASTGDTMAGVKGHHETILKNISQLAALTYVTVGVVVTDSNADELTRVIELADKLDVDDIRIIPAAQDGDTLEALKTVGTQYRDKYPILRYRSNNSRAGAPIRGISEHDCHTCGLVQDDTVVSGRYHYPCIIYMREGGYPIGVIHPKMRDSRVAWMKEHDSFKDPICRKNCLDVCVAFNNKRGDSNG